tara:strand:+ start:161 stop:271 length:111 start_codon:yes stop_codon:yes gene_type:complete
MRNGNIEFNQKDAGTRLKIPSKPKIILEKPHLLFLI